MLMLTILMNAMTSAEFYSNVAAFTGFRNTADAFGLQLEWVKKMPFSPHTMFYVATLTILIFGKKLEILKLKRQVQ